MTYKHAKDFVDKIEKASDALADELASHGQVTPKFRKLWRELKKLVTEGDARFDG